MNGTVSFRTLLFGHFYLNQHDNLFSALQVSRLHKGAVEGKQNRDL
jgi:hypothetical protein